MKLTIKNIIHISITTLFLLCGVSQAQQIKLGNLPKTCLPEEGRMMPDRSKACHCPPADECNKIVDYKDIKTSLLPQSIVEICCGSSITTSNIPSQTLPPVISPPDPECSALGALPQPIFRNTDKECDVHYFKGTHSNCSDKTVIGPRTARNCLKYGTQDIATRQNVLDLNSCMADNCLPIYERLRNFGGAINRTNSTLMAGERGLTYGRENFELTGQRLYTQYSQCRMDCHRSNNLMKLVTPDELNLHRWVVSNFTNSVQKYYPLRANGTAEPYGIEITTETTLDKITPAETSKLIVNHPFISVNQFTIMNWLGGTYDVGHLRSRFINKTYISVIDQMIGTNRTIQTPLPSSFHSHSRVFKFDSMIPSVSPFRSSTHPFGMIAGFIDLKRFLSVPTKAYQQQCVGGVYCEEYLDINSCITTFSYNASCTTCLSPDTQVRMFDGSSKKISDIKLGDAVATEGNKKTLVVEVVEKKWSMLNIYTINNQLKLTPDHPVMTKRGWKAIQPNSEKTTTGYGLNKVGKLVVGDILITDKGEVKVEHIKADKMVKDGTTYNLKLQKPSNSFYANGFLVKSHL